VDWLGQGDIVTQVEREGQPQTSASGSPDIREKIIEQIGGHDHLEAARGIDQSVGEGSSAIMEHDPGCAKKYSTAGN
jgi:hypothetical protein